MTYRAYTELSETKISPDMGKKYVAYYRSLSDLPNSLIIHTLISTKDESNEYYKYLLNSLLSKDNIKATLF